MSDWQIASCTAAPQTVQSTERPINVMHSIAPGIVGNLSGGAETWVLLAITGTSGRMRETAGWRRDVQMM